MSGIFGLNCSPSAAKIVLLPVCWDATASYGKGTHKAPQALVQASYQLDLLDPAFNCPYKAGIAMLAPEPSQCERNQQASALVDSLRLQRAEDASASGSKAQAAESLKRINAWSEQTNREVFRLASQLLESGKKVGVVGGDHSSPFGLIEALAQKHGAFGILHLDAHCDLREAYEGFAYSHASIMHNVLTRIPEVCKLVQVGIRDFCEDEVAFALAQGERVALFYDHALFRHKASGGSYEAWVKELIAALPPKVYVSFDIDALQPTYCPTTGTPVPGGLDYNEAIYLLEELAFSGRELIGFDLCEVGVPEGLSSEWDSNVGARILYKLCGALLHPLFF